MVDVVGVVDWLDNVTTSSRRIYTGVEKTFDEAICEAIALERTTAVPSENTNL